MRDRRNVLALGVLGAMVLTAAGLPAVARDCPPAANVEATELAAWTMVASAILNLDEAITKE